MSHYKQGWRAALGEDGLAGINKFGESTGIGTGEVTVWPSTNVYAYPAAAAVMKVSSASTADVAGSSGAATITVQGLDADYTEIEETVAINGASSTAAAVTVNSYLRINRAFVATEGGNGSNIGAVSVGTGAITGGVPANQYAIISAGENQTLQAVYTVPASKRLLLQSLKLSTGAAAKVVTARLVARPLGGTLRVQEKFSMPAGAISFGYDPAKVFEPKTDIEVRALTSIGTETASAGFDGALVPVEST